MTVMPAFRSRAAYEKSRWARDLGYIEEPVTMAAYLESFREAGLVVEWMDYDDSRESGPSSWKRRLAGDGVYRFYRRRVRPLYAQTNFIFICRFKKD